MSIKDGKLVWSLNGERFNYQSLEELISVNEGIKEGQIVYCGKTGKIKYSDLFDGEDVVDMVWDRAYDILGDLAEDYIDFSKEAAEELETLLHQWMDKNFNPDCYKVTDVKEYIISESDLKGGDDNERKR